MPDPKDAFDKLLDAMVNKPPLEVEKAASEEADGDDLREDDES